MKKALEAFERGLEEGVKTAGVLDWLSNIAAKAWAFVTNAFAGIADWISNLGRATKGFESMMNEAGA